MVFAGAHVLAEDQQDGTLAVIGDVTYRKKASTESVTSSVVLQSDNDLTIDLPIGVFDIQLYLHVSGATAGDIRTAWLWTGTATAARCCMGPNETTVDCSNTNVRSSVHAVTTEVVCGVESATSSTSVRETVFLDVSIAGTLTLQWAQGTSSATATTLSTASRMIVTRIG